MGSFPLVTLAPTIDTTGISKPSYSDILSSFIASLQSIFGSDVLLTPDTQEYQFLAVQALAISDTGDLIIDVYNMLKPSFAQGAGLSALVKLNGLQRQIPTNSTVVVTITGTVGTVINGGQVQDTLGNLWNLPAIVVIPSGGSISVTATAVVVGAIAAAAGTVTIIATPTIGWQTVTNAAAATPGAAVETDAALRIRQGLSTGAPAQTPLQAIAAAIANIPGVTRSLVYENSTSATDSNGVPSHSIAVIVQGGVAATIAATIEAKKSPGTGTAGTTTIVVNDPGGLAVPINFYVLATTAIYVNITIKAGTNYVNTTGTALINALVAAVNALAIGATVFYNFLMGVASLADTLGVTFHVSSMTVRTAPSPTGTGDVAIAFNAAASTDSTKINLTTI